MKTNLRTDLENITAKIGELSQQKASHAEGLQTLEAHFVTGTVQASEVQAKRQQLDSTTSLIESLQARKDAVENEINALQSSNDRSVRLRELQAAAEAGSVAVSEYHAIREEFSTVITDYAKRIHDKHVEIGENKQTFRSGVAYLTAQGDNENGILAAASISTDALRTIRENGIKTGDRDLAFNREIGMIEGVYSSQQERAKELRLVA